MLFAFMAYKLQFTSRATAQVEKAIELKMLGLHTERVADIALSKPETEAPGHTTLAGRQMLDIEVGGLSEFASGNRARIVRRQNGEETVINVRINDLLNRGDMSQNVRMRPGDVLIIPESVF